jgi:7-cyano-7-deazaguanine synthase
VTRAVVLLSGGQDSATCLFWARHRLPVTEVHALTCYYGQRHHAELAAAHEIGRLADVESHVEVDLGPLFYGSASAMFLGSRAEVAAGGGMRDAAAPAGLPTTFVPGRNLLFLAAAVAHAGTVGADYIVTGVCQTDYSGYPDCRLIFIDAFNRAARAGWPSGHPAPEVKVPLMQSTKADTVRLMYELAVLGGGHAGWRESAAWRALGMSVTCYRGLRPGCGECPACQLRARGFADAGFSDPAGVRPEQGVLL